MTRFTPLLYLLGFAAACGIDPDQPDDPLVDELELLRAETQAECGTLKFAYGIETCPDTSAALSCFTSSARPHIVQQRTTIEGDPIYEHYFGDDSGRVIALHDARADHYGSQRISRIGCSRGLTELDLGEGQCAQIVCAE